MVESCWVCHCKMTFCIGGCDGIRGLAYSLFCAAYRYWSRQPRVFRCLSRSCLTLDALNFSEGTKTYLHFISFLLIYMLVEILSHVRHELIYSTWSISRVPIFRRRKGTGPQQPWYLLCWTELIRSTHVNPWGAGTELSLFNFVNIMVANALAQQPW